MSSDFATALQRALEKTRGADPAAATAIIQSVLRGTAPQPQERAGTESGTPTNPFASLMRDGCLPCAGSATGLGGISGLRLPETRRAAPPVPEGARYESRRHDGAAGSRDFRLFVPSQRPEGYAGVLVMLHGCTQTPDDFALGTRMNLAAEQVGMVVAYPAQTAAHNMQSCWNWFRPEDQRRGGEPAILAALAVDLAREFDTPPGRVFVAGLSAGGAMAAILAEVYPDVFAAAGVHSGLPAGSARDVASAFAAMRGQGGGRRTSAARLIVFHGGADATVADVNGTRLVPGSGVETTHSGNGRQWTRLAAEDGSELWRISGAGHAWAGGDPAGSYADPLGPDASAEMLRFFLAPQVN